MEYTNETVLKTVHDLVEAWCDRRQLKALRNIFKGYPLSSPLTDGWAELLDALESVRAFASEELTDEEKVIIGQLIAVISKAVYRE